MAKKEQSIAYIKTYHAVYFLKMMVNFCLQVPLSIFEKATFINWQQKDISSRRKMISITLKLQNTFDISKTSYQISHQVVDRKWISNILDVRRYQEAM